MLVPLPWYVALPVRSWQRRQVVWMLAAVDGVPTWLRSLVGWQPAPLLPQPALVLVCFALAASVWNKPFAEWDP